MPDTEKLSTALDEISLYFYECYRNAGGGTKSLEKFHDWMSAVDNAKKLISRKEGDENA